MRYLLSLALLLTVLTARSQELLRPAVGLFQHQWITNDKYAMEMFMVKEDSSQKIGDIAFEITVSKADVVVATSVKSDRGTMTDSTVGDRTTLQPIYRSSYSNDLDMNLHFGKIVTGYYNHKFLEKNTSVSDTTEGLYFDANMYPILLGWLPLEQGYTKNIAIYNFDPERASGVLEASILSVGSDTYKTKKEGIRDVWMVKVTDQVFGGLNTYYFDKTDRRLWKQEIEFPLVLMRMMRVE